MSIENTLKNNGYTNNLNGWIDALTDLNNEDETNTLLLQLVSEKTNEIKNLLIQFTELIKKDFGTGNGNEIDENLLDYSELSEIYHNSVKALKENEQCK